MERWIFTKSLCLFISRDNDANSACTVTIFFLYIPYIILAKFLDIFLQYILYGLGRVQNLEISQFTHPCMEGLPLKNILMA